MAFTRSVATAVIGSLFGCASYTQDDMPPSMSASGAGAGGAGASTAMSGAAGGGRAGASSAAGFGGGTSGSASGGAGGTFSSAGKGGTAGTTGDAGTTGRAGAAAAGGAGGQPAGGASSGGGAGGSGGDGGRAATSDCTAHPIPAKATWTASASLEAGPCPGMPNPDFCGPASRAIDGKLTPVNLTRYTSGAARTGDEWLQIDFGTTVTLSEITLRTAAGSDYTRDYEVRVSDQAATIAASPVATSGSGKPDVTAIALPQRVTGRFLRINQLTSDGSWWSIQELEATCK